MAFDINPNDVIRSWVEPEEIVVKFDELTEAQQKEVRRSYESILGEKFAKHLSDVLKDLVNELHQTQLLQNIEDEDLKRFINNTQIELDFKQARQLCIAMEKHLLSSKYTCETVADSKVLNSAYSTLFNVWPFYNFDIPKYVQAINEVSTIGERKHYLKRKRKSWFRRIIEFVFPFLRTSDQEEIIIETEKLGSLQKGATGWLGEKLIKSSKKNAMINMKQLVADINSANDPDTMRIPLPKEVRSLKQESKSKAQKAYVAADVAGKGFKVIAAGCMRYVNHKLSGYTPLDYLASYLSDPSNKELDKDLDKHIKDAFEVEAKKVAFEGMMEFVAKLYAIHETTERVRSNHGEALKSQDIDTLKMFEELGFGHIGTDEFKVFMSGLSRSLGFSLDTSADARPAIYQLYYASDEVKNVAFAKFLEGDKKAKVGMRYVSTLMEKEQKRIDYEKKQGVNLETSGNYRHLFSLEKQMIYHLRKSTIIDNGMAKGIGLLNIEDDYLSFRGNGLTRFLSDELKGQLVENLPVIRELQLGYPMALQQEVTGLGEAYIKGVCDKFTAIINKYYTQNNDTDNPVDEVENKAVENSVYAMVSNLFSTLWYGNQMHLGVDNRSDSFKVQPNSGSDTTQRHKAWQESENLANEKDFPEDYATDLLAKAQQQAKKQWQKRGAETLALVGHLGGVEFIENMKREFESSLEQVKSYASEGTVEKLEEKIAVLNVLLKDDSTRTMNELRNLPYPLYESLFKAVNDGVQMLYAKGKYKTFDEQADLFMMQTALTHVAEAGVPPSEVFGIYKNVIKTDFDYHGNGSTLSPAIERVAVFAADKVQALFQRKWSGVSQSQLKYYTTERKRGKHIAGVSSSASEAIEHSEDLGSWSQGRIGNFASSVYNVASWGATGLGWAITGVGEAVEVAELTLAQYLEEKITGNKVKTPEALNEVVVRNCKELLREQTYESAYDIACKINDFVEKASKFKKKRPGIDVKAYKEFGCYDEKHLRKFLAELTLSLGFNTPDEMAKAKTTFVAAETSLFDQVKQDFIKLPESAREVAFDKFVTLKHIIQEENKTLAKNIKRGKVKDAHNFVVLVSSLNNLVYNVELAQRGVVAGDFLSASALEKMLSSDPQASGLLAKLKENALDKASSYASETAKDGIMRFLQSSIAVTNQLTQGMLDESIHQLDIYLKQAQKEAIKDIVVRLAATKTKKGVSAIFKQYPELTKSPIMIERILMKAQRKNKQLLMDNLINHLASMRKNPVIKEMLISSIQEDKFDIFKMLLASNLDDEFIDILIVNLKEKIKEDPVVGSKMARQLIMSKDLQLNDNVIELIKDIQFQGFRGISKTKSSLPEVEVSYYGLGVDNDLPKLEEMRDFLTNIEACYEDLKQNAYHCDVHIGMQICEIEVYQDIEDLSRSQIDEYQSQLDTYQSQVDKMAIQYENLEKLKTAGLQYYIKNLQPDNLARLQKQLSTWDKALDPSDVRQKSLQGLSEAQDALQSIREQRKVLFKQKKEESIDPVVVTENIGQQIIHSHNSRPQKILVEEVKAPNQQNKPARKPSI